MRVMALPAPPRQEEHAMPWPAKQFSSQLAAAVRSINWTYAIFWSLSTSRPGVLTWNAGFYNGEVKTRKITSSVSVDLLTADQLVLQRSEQLRELYESLLSGECGHRARRPAASLSPEDLGDAEWYYTVSMTYAFRPGQGLPGKSFASNQYVWLCNAQFADTKTFQRALLAKTASIQTVACIPFMGGVLELGTANQVLEDTDLVNRVGTSFWELQFWTRSQSEASSSRPPEKEVGAADMVDHNAADAMISGEMECPSDDNLERITKELYGLWEDNWILDGLDGSLEVIMSSPEAALVRDGDGITDDVESSRPSCFTAWKTPSVSWVAGETRESQKLLKKALTGGAWTNGGGPGGGTGGTPRARQSTVKGHVMSERRRREKLNEMFLILKSLVPSVNKVDKASILAETIAYLKALEQKVGELESRTRPMPEAGRHDDVTGKKLSTAGSKRRRKASELDTDLSGGPSNVVNVSVMGKEVLLNVQCRWNELLMTRVFDALKALAMDVLSVQASTSDGLLALTIRAQYAGSASAAVAPAAGMISEALQKAIAN